jgi:hypothetical protein
MFQETNRSNSEYVSLLMNTLLPVHPAHQCADRDCLLNILDEVLDLVGDDFTKTVVDHPSTSKNQARGPLKCEGVLSILNEALAILEDDE